MSRHFLPHPVDPELTGDQIILATHWLISQDDPGILVCEPPGPDSSLHLRILTQDVPTFNIRRPLPRGWTRSPLVLVHPDEQTLSKLSSQRSAPARLPAGARILVLTSPPSSPLLEVQERWLLEHHANLWPPPGANRNP